MENKQDRNLTWCSSKVDLHTRENLNHHKSAIIWLTGLSASGKSTIAFALENILVKNQINAYVLDGDNIRQGLNQDLGFSDTDRKENIRRIGEVAKLMMDSGCVVIAAFISPFREDRDAIRLQVKSGRFIEVFIDCPLNECELRDPKGLYKKARAGQIVTFTGLTSPYERPLNPEIHVNTNDNDVVVNVQQILEYLQQKEIIPSITVER